jgi:hypothetical protein
MALDDAVAGFKQYLEQIPDRQKAKDVLRKRPLPLYRALGISEAKDLARSLASDRLIASREMVMGYLYERILQEACGATKLNNAQKKEWKGIDFRKETGQEIFLINLKSSRQTPNSDITTQTTLNLVAAAKHAKALQDESFSSGDDNPLSSARPTIIPVRAIARGVPSPESIKQVDEIRIRILVGDTLWQRLGAGPHFTRQIETELGKQPVDKQVVEKGETAFRERILNELRLNGCVGSDGSLIWPSVLSKFPDQ